MGIGQHTDHLWRARSGGVVANAAPWLPLSLHSGGDFGAGLEWPELGGRAQSGDSRNRDPTAQVWRYRARSIGMPATCRTARGGCPGHGCWTLRYGCATSTIWDDSDLRHGGNSMLRTAEYVTRSAGGLGGRCREAFSVPIRRRGKQRASETP